MALFPLSSHSDSILENIEFACLCTLHSGIALYNTTKISKLCNKEVALGDVHKNMCSFSSGWC